MEDKEFSEAGMKIHPGIIIKTESSLSTLAIPNVYGSMVIGLGVGGFGQRGRFMVNISCLT